LRIPRHLREHRSVLIGMALIALCGSALAAMIVPAISLALLSLSAIVMLAAWRSPPNVGFDFGPSPSRIRSARSPRRKER
jgi:hypothetical protein